MFVPKREMRIKQRESFEKSKDAEGFALFMRMRTGKSKVALDTGCYNYIKGRLNAIVIIAPKGVHSKWIIEDLPKDIPDYIDYTSAIWRSGNKKAIAECEKLLTVGNHLRIVAVNIEALSRAKSDAEKFLISFLNATDALLIIDESHTIGNPKAKRTETVLKISNKAKMRRILTGTSTGGDIFKLYSQMAFVDTDVFGQSYFSFKHTYADILPDNHPTMIAIRARGARFLPVIADKDENGKVKWKNLDKLKKILEPHSFTCTLEECTDLPPTIYEKILYELDPKQRKIYDTLAKKAAVEFEDNSVTVAHKMTLALRLQQVLSGYLPSDTEDTMISLFDKPEDNPRVKALVTMLESLEEEGDQCIVWCRFTAEIKLLEKVLGDKCFTLYGATKNREEIKDRFMAGERPFIVANVAVGGTGLDYSGLYTMIYYSNDFNFINRDQSEARPLHVGQTRSLLVIDIEAEDTIDKKIVKAMIDKRDVSAEMFRHD